MNIKIPESLKTYNFQNFFNNSKNYISCEISALLFILRIRLINESSESMEKYKCVFSLANTRF